MTWQLTPHGVINFGNGIPTTRRGVIGAFTADLGVASRPGPAVIVAAPPYRPDGAARTVLIAGGRNRGRRVGRRAHRPIVGARSLPSVEHGGPVGPGLSGGKRRR